MRDPLVGAQEDLLSMTVPARVVAQTTTDLEEDPDPETQTAVLRISSEVAEVVVPQEAVHPEAAQEVVSPEAAMTNQATLVARETVAREPAGMMAPEMTTKVVGIEVAAADTAAHKTGPEATVAPQDRYLILIVQERITTIEDLITELHMKGVQTIKEDRAVANSATKEVITIPTTTTIVVEEVEPEENHLVTEKTPILAEIAHLAETTLLADNTMTTTRNNNVVASEEATEVAEVEHPVAPREEVQASVETVTTRVDTATITTVIVSPGTRQTETIMRKIPIEYI